jgi:hypothetical protein
MLTTERHQCRRGIRTRNPSKREAANQRLKPRTLDLCLSGQLMVVSPDGSGRYEAAKRQNRTCASISIATL